MTRIAIDPARAVGRLDRKVFGGFVEHLGLCIYGGLYEEGSPLSDDRGLRKDVLGLLRELRLEVLRWPGGNFVSNYHWADGIGPKDGRPRRPELAWGGEESNRFGTDEYLAYCAELGTSGTRWSSTGWRRWSTTTRCTSTRAARTTGPTCCSRTRPSGPSGTPGRSWSGPPTGRSRHPRGQRTERHGPA